MGYRVFTFLGAHRTRARAQYEQFGRGLQGIAQAPATLFQGSAATLLLQKGCAESRGMAMAGCAADTVSVICSVLLQQSTSARPSTPAQGRHPQTDKVIEIQHLLSTHCDGHGTASLTTMKQALTELMRWRMTRSDSMLGDMKAFLNMRGLMRSGTPFMSMNCTPASVDGKTSVQGPGAICLTDCKPWQTSCQQSAQGRSSRRMSRGSLQTHSPLYSQKSQRLGEAT